MRRSRNPLTIFLWTPLIVVSVLGCQRKPDVPKGQTVESNDVRIYTTEELNGLISTGMTIVDLTNKFGSPPIVNTWDDSVLFTYMFPSEINHKPGFYMSGFSVDLKDGRVVRWSPVTSMRGNILGGNESQGQHGEPLFEVFLAAGALTNIANIVDRQGSADASNLNVPPDIAFKAKVFAGNSGSGRDNEQKVILVVDEQYASQLEDLINRNIGKKLIIVCKKRAIAAPLITLPETRRQLAFTVKDANIVTSITQ